MVTTDKAVDEVRVVLESIGKFAAEKNVDGILGLYTPDAVSFDAIPPLVHDLETLRKNWQMCFEHCSMQSRLRDLRITVSGDIAFAHGILEMSGEHACNMRVTSCLRQINGEWKIVHDHLSAPFDPMTSQACLKEEK